MMELPRLLVSRHGQDTDNKARRLNGHRDTELTNLGRLQVRQTAERIAAQQFEVADIITSTLSRSRDSGAIYAQRLGLGEPLALPALIERDLGEVTGMTVARAMQHIATEDLIYTPHTVYAEHPKYGFETFEETENRIRPFLQYLSNTYGGNETVLVVAHGDINAALCAVALGTCMREIIQTLYIPNAGIVRIEDGQLYELEEEMASV